MPYLFVFWQGFKTKGLIFPLRYLITLSFILQAGLLFGMEPDDSLFVVSGITISGNRISKESIILKELTFKNGDRLTKKKIAEACNRSRENLLNTSLFNFVNIYQAEIGESEIHIHISVIERWYIWPSPIFEHAERNLGAFIHNPDWHRINYGGQIFWDNFRGRKERIRLKMRLGYKEQLEILYEKPNFGRNQQHGISLTLNQTRQHEVNVFAVNNKPVYVRSENSYLAEVFNPYFIYSYRSSLYSLQSLTLSYIGLKYRDSTTHQYFTGLPYGQNPAWFFGEYSFEYDFRNSKTYPLKGEYFRVNFRRYESLITNSNSYSRSSVILTAMHHGNIIDRLYYNNALRMEFAKDIYRPKANRGGLGYGPYLRGYELFVIDGNSYGLMVNNLKYCVMKEKTYNLANIPWSQFNPVHLSIYGNLFFDMAYVKGKYYGSDGNNYVNRGLYTVGLGLDFVSYYDQVLRLEVSVNREGRPGFFIHTEVPFSRW
jgi:outer membrane protein assembly factor BamA